MDSTPLTQARIDAIEVMACRAQEPYASLGAGALLLIDEVKRLRAETAAAVLAERERCAEVAEDTIVHLAHWKRIAEDVAAAIRARK